VTTTIDQFAGELLGIAEELAHTASLRRRDPEHWLEERDDIANRLRRIVGRLAKEHGVRAVERASRTSDRDAAVFKKTSRLRDDVIEVNGRRVRVQSRRSSFSV
jgi:hypothetical protein